jgi:hypothetical protein
MANVRCARLGDELRPLTAKTMRCRSRFRSAPNLACVAWLVSALFTSAALYAQSAPPTSDQLDQLLAPIALYPDALVAQICAASTDPQQILDADAWLKQNLTLTGQSRTDAAQAQGFDAAFISLVNFAPVLDMMAKNIDDYAAIGQAFSADQGAVMDSIQRLRQQAYAAGALESNQYQSVDVRGQGTSQVVVIQPANPQVVYLPQYSPQVVFVQPDPSTVVAASLITFGAGIALGAYIADANRPWGWGGWGWNWGRRSVYVQNNVWIVNNRYRPRYPTYHYRPPVYNRPVWVRPPPNWNNRPYYRPPPGGRPPPRPPVTPPPVVRPPIAPPPAVRPPGSGTPGTRPPGGRQPGSRPPGSQPPGSRPPVNPPAQGSRPPGSTRPAPGPRPQRPPNPDAGYPSAPGGGRGPTGGRPSAFGGGNNAGASREASSRGRASVASEQRHTPGATRR